MAVHSVKVMPDGRIQIPSQLRRELNFFGDETLDLELRYGPLSMGRPSKTLEAVRAMLAPYLDPEVDPQAELKAGLDKVGHGAALQHLPRVLMLV